MSNKTPSEPPAATASAPKRRPIHLFLGLLLIIVGTAALFSGVRSLIDDRQYVWAPKTRIHVTIADTPETRTQGLSGSEPLADKTGMLFKFDETSDKHCFWMKDMKYAIDILWIDDQKKVVHIEQHATPETFPKSFCPDEPARYVLEVGAGKAAEYGLAEGEQVRF